MRKAVSPASPSVRIVSPARNLTVCTGRSPCWPASQTRARPACPREPTSFPKLVHLRSSDSGRRPGLRAGGTVGGVGRRSERSAVSVERLQPRLDRGARGSRKGGSASLSPRVSSGSSTAKPGPSVAISNRMPLARGSRGSGSRSGRPGRSTARRQRAAARSRRASSRRRACGRRRGGRRRRPAAPTAGPAAPRRAARPPGRRAHLDRRAPSPSPSGRGVLRTVAHVHARRSAPPRSAPAAAR